MNTKTTRTQQPLIRNTTSMLQSVLAMLAVSAGLFIAPSAKAAIAILDGPSPIRFNSVAATGTAPLNSASFTVSPGASVLVVFPGTRTQGASPAPASDPGTPTTLTWNGNTLKRAVTKGTTSSTWDDNAIFYLYNPPAGSGSVSGTLIAQQSQCWWMAYTLTGVDTNATILTNTASAQAQTINDTVASVGSGYWASVATSASTGTHSTLAITTSPSGGTVLTTTDSADGNADMTFGSVSNCPGGSLQFISTAGAANANPKLVLEEAIFAPFVSPPLAPNWSSVTTGNPAQVNLSWTTITNASFYLLARGTVNGGPYTDFTNIVNGTSYQDSQVLSGTQYFYVVSAANSAGTNASVQTNATPVGTVFPPVLGGGAAGVGNVGLVWTPSFGATNYLVLKGASSGSEVQIATSTSNKFTVSGLTPGSTNYFTVKAVGASGTSGPSGEISVITLGSHWFLFDNFSLDTVGSALNNQTGSAGLGRGWTNLGGGSPILVSNTPTPFGGANYAQYAPNSPSGIGDYEAGLGIPGSSKASTVFLEFSLPGIIPIFTGTNVAGGNAGVVAMNFDIDNANPPTALTGQSAAGPSAQFNYDNSSGFGFFRVLGGNTFYFASIGPTNTPYLPIPGNLYYFWFVLNASNATYQIYLADGSMTGNNLDTGGLGAAPTLMWGATATNTTGSLINFGFRNVTAGGTNGVPVDYIGTGPGSVLGTVPQNQFANIYVDTSGQNLTNPVTGQPPTGAPQVLVQPQALQLFAGSTAMFSIVGSAGVTFQWQSNGVSMVDGGRVSGSQTSTLTISNVTIADAINYTCIVKNPATSAFGSSSPASLTIVTPSGPVESAMAAAAVSHLYAFDDAGNPGLGGELAFDYAGADNGVYGANTLNGFDSVPGPRPADGFAGFPATNAAAQFTGFNEPNHVTVGSPWNLNTNTLTITAWLNPLNTAATPLTGLVVNRGSGSDVEGLIFNSTVNSTLGYNWNNDPNTTGWDSGLQLPASQWSFVSLTVTPTNATINVMNTNGVSSATHTYPHTPALFAGTTMIGDDPGTTSGALTFNGYIDEVGVFNQALSETQLQSMFANASGLSNFPASNTVALLSPQPIYPGQSALFNSVDAGSYPMTFTWQIDGTNLTDGATVFGNIYGSATPSLLISNLTVFDAGQTFSLTLVSSNASGAYTSAVPAMLAVSQPSAPTVITTTTRQAQGTDWNTGASWSDGNPVSVSIFSAPGSAYQVVPGTLERSPVSTNAVFPGNVLVLEGDGVLLDGNAGSFATQTTTGELRLKESGTTTATNSGTVYTVGGSVTFPDLQLNGGQLDNGSSSAVELDGRIDVLTNSSIYVDSAAAGSIRSFQVNAFLTGTGTLTYSDIDTGYASNTLVISCATNTFSGQWNVQQGGLVGNAPGSLGTNSISVAANGSLETTYNLSNATAALLLNGQLHLYTTDTFFAVVLNGTNLAPGTYSFAQLNSAYPANFPATWQVQLGSSTGTNTGVGSLTALGVLPPLFTQQPSSLSLYPGQTANFTALAPTATAYHWWFTNLSNVGAPLSDGGNISGSGSNSLTITNVSSANEGTYVVVASDAGGSRTSASATLTLLATGPPETITTTQFEPGGSDWNTPAS
ncbi:MAG TPA: immunoglobulin domain-containing protein, partial [Candidatus Dormibacteraeota bacterium]|nr:immunoglobulin domain-containing protein [Candidatus Dormibacteraeota bacterium]